ncbi:MAG: SprT-like domain-containing protein [Halarcobacter sp.]
MFLKRLKLFFLVTTLLASVFLISSWYKTYQFENNPLDVKILKKIKIKQYELQTLAYKKFGVSRKIPVLVSNKMPSSLYGAATFSKENEIKIYLNKKRFKESSDYMLDNVLPHEYAHALMFAINDFTKQNAGHSLKWQKICIALNGLKCDRFVKEDDIIIGKTNFFGKN